jgi:hypothetical protein
MLYLRVRKTLSEVADKEFTNMIDDSKSMSLFQLTRVIENLLSHAVCLWV